MNKASFASGIRGESHTQPKATRLNSARVPDLEHFLSLNDVTLHGQHIHCVLDRGETANQAILHAVNWWTMKSWLVHDGILIVD